MRKKQRLKQTPQKVFGLEGAFNMLELFKIVNAFEYQIFRRLMSILKKKSLWILALILG